jgi:hypothetical protein
MTRTERACKAMVAINIAAMGGGGVTPRGGVERPSARIGADEHRFVREATMRCQHQPHIYRHAICDEVEEKEMRDACVCRASGAATPSRQYT